MGLKYLKLEIILILIQIQMYKRKDNDIFGTNDIGYSPKIENNSYIDPNAVFKKNTENNYQKYASQINQVPRAITAKSKDTSRVNERAEFEDNYHKNRKQQDLQSSIFYPPPKMPSRQETVQQYQPKSEKESNFGRKQTLNREINNLPYNTAEIKGNSSRLFDLDTRVKTKTEISNPIIPLIPYQMQWSQHDSVKYAYINDPLKKNNTETKVDHQAINSIKESKSTYFPVEPEKIQKKEQINKKSEKNISRVKSETKIPSAKEISNAKKQEPVEVKILKGWNFKLMEGLSKHCKLNNVAILKFEVGEKDQATLVIKRSERWENVTDWLRKDAKLKIRVLNN